MIACVGGGSNAIGTFVAFLDDAEVELIGVEAAGEGLDSGRHGASLVAGRTGVLHGALSSVLADEDGQILEAHSVSAGLDYPGVGPEHAQLRDTGRARYEAVTDDEALRAFRELARLEGIIPALEPVPRDRLAAREHPPATRERGDDGYDVLTLSGRGDKDLAEVVEQLGSMAERRPAPRPSSAPRGEGPRRADALHDGRLPRPRGLAARSPGPMPSPAPT